MSKFSPVLIGRNVFVIVSSELPDGEIRPTKIRELCPRGDLPPVRGIDPDQTSGPRRSMSSSAATIIVVKVGRVRVRNGPGAGHRSVTGH
jgi:hypothetical protein